MDPPLTTRWTLLSPPDGLNEPSSVIHRLIFGDEGDDTAAVPQVGYDHCCNCCGTIGGDCWFRSSTAQMEWFAIQAWLLFNNK